MATTLGAKLADAGISRLLFVRHANAAPPGSKAKGEYGTIHDWQADDQKRPLTEKGQAQAAVARGWFLKQIGLSTNKALVTSGARRASETLQIMGEETRGEGTQVSMSLLIGLHPAGIAPRCEELFDKHGYAPLATFHAMEGGEAAFGEYGETMAAGLGEMVEQLKGVPGNSLSLWGHAVFLNALALVVLKVWGGDQAAIDNLLSLDLGEAEGILLEHQKGVCTLRHLRAAPPTSI